MIITSLAFTEARPRTAGNRAWLWFALGLGALLLGLLIGPRVPDDQQAARCVVNIHLPGPFGVALHCDSPEFLRLAAAPFGLLEPKNTRQSRPGFILTAALVALPMAPLVSLVGVPTAKASRPDIDPNRIAQALSQQLPDYAAYILLNLMVLAATYLCVLSITSSAAADPGHAGQIIVAATGLLVVASDVTKAYFWTPHTQMFNLFIPVFGLYAVAAAGGGAFRERRFAIVAGVVTGLGMTCYPTFVVLIPCILIAGLLRWLFEQPRRRDPLGTMVGFTVLAIGPLLAWYLFVRWQVGGFYSEEISSVSGPSHWIPEVFARGGVTAIALFVLDAFRRCVMLAAQQATALVALGAIVVAMAMTHPSAVAAALRRNIVLLVSALFLDLAIGMFYAASGDMHFRWAAALVPPLAVAAGVVILSTYHALAWLGQRLLQLACMAAVIAQIAFTVAKDGPFS